MQKQPFLQCWNMDLFYSLTTFINQNLINTFKEKKKVITQWPRKIFVIICLGILSAADYCQKRSAQLSGLKFKADILQSLVNSVLFLY